MVSRSPISLILLFIIYYYLFIYTTKHYLSTRKDSIWLHEILKYNENPSILFNVQLNNIYSEPKASDSSWGDGV
jgi:hypothetical protein